MRVAIRFGPTNASGLQRAIALAGRLPSYRVEHGNHRIEETITAANWRTIMDLWEVVAPWKSYALEVDGVRAGWRELTEVMDVFRCHAERESSGLGDRYCVGQKATTDDPLFIGCRFARGVRLAMMGGSGLHEPGSEWWKFGTLDPDGQSFLVDKEEIERIVLLQTSRAPAAGCPAWSVERVKAVLKWLPRALVVGEGWELRYSELDPGRPVGVTPEIPQLLKDLMHEGDEEP